MPAKKTKNEIIEEGNALFESGNYKKSNKDLQ